MIVADGKVAYADDNSSLPVMGIVRPKAWNKNSAVIGNAAWNYWTDKYLTDDFGCYELEDDLDAGDGEKKKKLNPAYTGPTDRPDPNYISRRERNEWNLIGLLGQVQIVKGQRVDSRWIKMKNISDTVELWYIR